MVVPKPKAKLCESGEDEQPRKSRINWARLLKRVFGIDLETCHLCGDGGSLLDWALEFK
jgi:NAD-dependent dihydropyrimidine dehydrogenase PreA subunit